MNDIRAKVALKEKVGYGFGDFASSMFWKIFTFYLAIFYTDVFGIPAAAVGTMLLVTRFWDTANDPLMGIICDRTNSRWGKFRPYLLWIAFPFGIIGVLLFTTPDFSVTGKLIYAYITYTLMMMVYTAINVPYASLLGVMTADTNQRTVLASFRMVFAFGGSILVVVIFQPLVDLFQDFVTDTRAYQLTMVVVSSLAVLFFLLSFNWTRERIKPPKSQETSLKKDIKDLINNGPWFLLLGAGAMTIIFNSVRDGVAMYYFKYYIVDETAVAISKLTFTYSTIYIVLGQIINMIGVLMAKPVSAAIGKRKTFMYAMFMATALSALFFICNDDDIILIYTLQILISFCAGIVFPLLWSMYADAADYSEYKTGRRATGLVFSASSMTQKLGWTLGGSVTMWLLSLYGFKANIQQTPETITGIKLTLSVFPAIGALLSGGFMIFYKLSDKKVLDIEKELAQRRDESE